MGSHAFAPLIVVILAVLGDTYGQITQGTTVDAYTALIPVNIKCINDPVKGLSCAAEYPDQCREQWNFPNPCTADNIANNITKFVHPFDRTKFLMCGELGKLYVVQCPQFEVFHEGCGQCVGESAGLSASCEVPLTQYTSNPCTREAIIANKLFFAFPGNLSKFIHCDIWGKAWERICTPGEVWSQWDTACVLPSLINPCRRSTAGLTHLYIHPCDQAMYLQCDARGRAYAVTCDPGRVFVESRQMCIPTVEYQGTVMNNFCSYYKFGFRTQGGALNGGVVNTANQNSAITVNAHALDTGSTGTGSAFNGASSTTLLDLSGGLSSADAQNMVNLANAQVGGATVTNGGTKTASTAGTGTSSIITQTVNTQGHDSATGLRIDLGNAGASIGIDQGNGKTFGADLAFGVNPTGVVDPTSGQTSFIIDNTLAQVSSTSAVGQNAGANSGQIIAAGKRPSVTGGQELNAANSIQTVTSHGGVAGGAAANDLNAILASWQTSVDVANGVNNNMGITNTVMNSMKLHPSQLKGYRNSDISFTEPCTPENIIAGRLYFKVLNDPHRYIQCDAGGVMHLRICSTHGRDWFDVYSNTCVDGPVHVDDLVSLTG